MKWLLEMRIDKRRLSLETKDKRACKTSSGRWRRGNQITMTDVKNKRQETKSTSNAEHSLGTRQGNHKTKDRKDKRKETERKMTNDKRQKVK